MIGRGSSCGEATTRFDDSNSLALTAELLTMYERSPSLKSRGRSAFIAENLLRVAYDKLLISAQNGRVEQAAMMSKRQSSAAAELPAG